LVAPCIAWSSFLSGLRFALSIRSQPPVFFDVRTIAKMPARIDLGRSIHALATSVKSSGSAMVAPDA
jgi:hypothetical protein